MHVLFSISLGMPNVNTSATIAIRIIGFLTRLNGETTPHTEVSIRQWISLHPEYQDHSHVARSS